MLTVGHLAHVAALRGWHGRVMVKLASSMRRYGVDAAEFPALVEAARDAGLTVEAGALHLPLDGTDADRVAEIEAWLPHLQPDMPLWVSHLSPESFRALQAAHPERGWSARVGTALWHGAPRVSCLRLSAEVLQTRPVRAGEPAGYRHAVVPVDGTLVAIGAGSAAGVTPLDDPDPLRRSPFHFAHHRLSLLEPPHMHTSLVVVPDGQPCPRVGDHVDVQRPLTTTSVDEVTWQ